MGKGKIAGGIVLIIFGVLLMSGAGFFALSGLQGSSQCPELLENLSQSLSGTIDENCKELIFSQAGALFVGIIGVALFIVGIVVIATR